MRAYQGNYRMSDNSVALSLTKGDYARLQVYSAVFQAVGATDEMVRKLGESLVEVGKKGRLQFDRVMGVADRVLGSIAAYREQGMDYNVADVVADEIDMTESLRSRRSRLKTAAGVTLAVLAGAAGAYGVDNPGSTNDANIVCNWDYQKVGTNLTGNATMSFFNLGSETRNELKWPVAGLNTLTDPPGWAHTYTNGEVTLTGQTDELDQFETINLSYTFDTNNTEVGEGDLEYFGDITSGTLTNIGTIVTNAIPPPPPPGGQGAVFKFSEYKHNNLLLEGVVAAILKRREKSI